MSILVVGFVKNGVVIPNSPLPEGAQVEIELKSVPPAVPSEKPERVSLAELRKMPREQRQAILAAAAERAESDYRSDKDLTGFNAFSEDLRGRALSSEESPDS